MDPLIDHMKATFRRQQDAFLQHPYPTLSERREKLKALKAALQRNQHPIAAAVSEDFGGRVAVGDTAGRGGRPGTGDQPRALQPGALDEAASPAHRTPVPHQPRLGDVPAQGRGRRDHSVEFSALSVGRAAGGRAGRRQSRDDQDVGVHAAHDGTARAACCASALPKTRSRCSAAKSRPRRLSPRCRSTTSSSPGRPPWACTSCVPHPRT